MSYSLLSSYLYEIDDVGYVYEKVWTKYAVSFLTGVYLWTAIALAAVLVAVGVAVYFLKREKLSSYVKCALFAAMGFGLLVLVSMFSLGFAEIAEKETLSAISLRNYVFIPSAVLGGVTVLAIIAVYVCGLISQKARKISLICSGSAVAAALIALLACIGVFYASGDAEYFNEATITAGENIGLYLSAVGVVILIIALALVFGKGEDLNFDSRAIAYAAVCIAMSFALSYIKFFEMPQGGSLTLASLLPLMIFSYMYGVRKGVLAGFAYGVLQAIQGLWFIHPAQFLLDYPVAFAAIGLAGMFAKVKTLDKFPQIKFALGAIAASLIRYCSHVLSGVFAFSEYAGAGASTAQVWAYSLGYNAFVFPDIAIAIAVGIILFSSRAFTEQLKRVSAAKKPADQPIAEAATADGMTAAVVTDEPDGAHGVDGVNDANGTNGVNGTDGADKSTAAPADSDKE